MKTRNRTYTAEIGEFAEISESAGQEKDDEQARLFDRFFPDFDVETEKRFMAEANENVEDDLDNGFWHTALKLHLGKEVMENAETECIKAACRGEMALADVLKDEAEMQKRLNDEIDGDPDSKVPEIQDYLNTAARVYGTEIR